MYGMVNRALQDLVVTAYSPQTWDAIAQRANVDVDIFVSSEGYPDAMTYSLIGAASDELKIPVDQLLEQFGVHWIVITAQRGYGDMMASGGSTLREFLLNLPVFHARLSIIFPHLAPPEFACSDIRERAVRMHYRSERPGLAPFVKGLFLGLGQMYDTPVSVEQVAEKAAGADHDQFEVSW